MIIQSLSMFNVKFVDEQFSYNNFTAVNIVLNVWLEKKLKTRQNINFYAWEMLFAAKGQKELERRTRQFIYLFY